MFKANSVRGIIRAPTAHLAIFKQSVEMAKGDASAFNLVAAYAGEKPTENVNVSVADPGVMDEIRRRMDGEVK